MPFEAVVCPECRADKDFTQVEPDTYYCPFHKGLFKYVDPRQLKVKVEETYCPCGNRAEFQCQLCKEPHCRECETVGVQRRRDGSEIIMSSVLLDSPGFGYMAVLLAVHQYKRWSLSEGGLVAKKPASGLAGPFLMGGDVLPQIPAAVNGVLRHLCLSCLSARVPAAAKRIAAREQCEVPGCGEPAQKRCRCCAQGFCAEHVAPRDEYAPTRPVAVSGGDGGRPGANYWMVRVGWTDYYFHKLSDVCGMCSGERVEQARREIVALCEAQPGIFRLKPGQGMIAPGEDLFGIGSGGKQRKLNAIGDRVGSLIMNTLSDLAKLPGSCRRNEGFPENAVSRWPFVYPYPFPYRTNSSAPS